MIKDKFGKIGLGKVGSDFALQAVDGGNSYWCD